MTKTRSLDETRQTSIGNSPDAAGSVCRKIRRFRLSRFGSRWRGGHGRYVGLKGVLEPAIASYRPVKLDVAVGDVWEHVIRVFWSSKNHLRLTHIQTMLPLPKPRWQGTWVSWC